MFAALQCRRRRRQPAAPHARAHPDRPADRDPDEPRHALLHRGRRHPRRCHGHRSRRRRPVPVRDDREPRPLHQPDPPRARSPRAHDRRARHGLRALAARILVDPSDPGDLTAVAALQDLLRVEADSAEPFVMPDYDSRASTPAQGAPRLASCPASTHPFGAKGEVDPVRHLIATATGWGGLPTRGLVQASKHLPVGEYRITVPADVPVDAFWSISVYNASGFFEPNEQGAYSVNSVTGQRNADGSITVHLGGCRRSSELHPDHGRLELHGAPLPPPGRRHRRHLDLPGYRTRLNEPVSGGRSDPLF